MTHVRIGTVDYRTYLGQKLSPTKVLGEEQEHVNQPEIHNPQIEPEKTQRPSYDLTKSRNKEPGFIRLLCKSHRFRISAASSPG